MEIQSVKAETSGQTFLVKINGSEESINPNSDTEKAKALAKWFIAGNRAEPAQTPFEKRKSGSMTGVLAQVLKSRRILTQHASMERVIYVSQKAALAKSEATSDLTNLVFGIEGAVAKSTPASRMQRSLELAMGAVIAGSFVEGLEQRAYDAVEAATDEASLDIALQEIEIAQGLAVCGVACVQANEIEKISTLILPAYNELNNNGIVAGGNALQALMGGSLGVVPLAIASALVAELEG